MKELSSLSFVVSYFFKKIGGIITKEFQCYNDDEKEFHYGQNFCIYPCNSYRKFHHNQYEDQYHHKSICSNIKLQELFLKYYYCIHKNWCKFVNLFVIKYGGKVF